MTEHEVIIAGGGPAGLMLAGELKLADIDVAIIERRADQHVAGSRGSGLHIRTIEILDQRGIADRFVAEGQKHPAVMFQVPLDITDFPTRHNYTLGIWQSQVERLLAEWIDSLGVTIHRRREVTGFTQDDAGVDVALADGETMRAAYLVGCDGARSIVRKTAGIEFPGWEATTSWLIAEVATTEEPAWGLRETETGTHAIGRSDAGGARIVLTEAVVKSGDAPTFDEFRAALASVYGTDFGARDPKWVSRFTDMTRQAASYRKGRVLIAGDAAHVHPPLGGQGLNLGVQDSVNLGWKLAQVVRGTSPETLLDTYEAERHPVAARVLRNTMAQSALRRPDERSKAAHEYVAGFMRMEEPRRQMAAEITGLGIRYDFGEGHPLLGRRMPDLDIETASGTVRVYALLHDARGVLLNLDNAVRIAGDEWKERVPLVAGAFDGAWELPAIGTVTAPTAVLVRPDGYVAWVGEGTDEGLREALTKWFGMP